MALKDWKKRKTALDGKWVKGKKIITLDMDYRGSLVHINTKPAIFRNHGKKSNALKYINKYMETH